MPSNKKHDGCCAGKADQVTSKKQSSCAGKAGSVSKLKSKAWLSQSVLNYVSGLAIFQRMQALSSQQSSLQSMLTQCHHYMNKCWQRASSAFLSQSTSQPVAAQSCCRRQSRPQYSYLAALGVLLMGHVSNLLASWVYTPAVNLAYWWVTAGFVLMSFQLSPERFFRYDQAVRSAFAWPLVVLTACYLPLIAWPVLAQSWAWQWGMGAAVFVGYWMMMHHLYHFKQSLSARWRFGIPLASVLSAGVLVLAAGFSLQVFAVAMFSCIVGHVVAFRQYLRVHGGKSQMRLAGALTLAMGMSWGYSFLKLAVASWGMTSIASLFFCDCWKTMGVVMLADKMRDQVGLWRQSQQQTSQTDRVLLEMIPLVLGAGYIMAAVWASLLPELGWGLPMRVFATVLVTACPCVISLAEPVVGFVHQQVTRWLAVDVDQKAMDLQPCVQRNLAIVQVYYVVSTLLACGGSYALMGVWMTPWRAGLLMLLGQLMLVVNTTVFSFTLCAQAKNMSLWGIWRSYASSYAPSMSGLRAGLLGVPAMIGRLAVLMQSSFLSLFDSSWVVGETSVKPASPIKAPPSSHRTPGDQSESTSPGSVFGAALGSVSRSFMRDVSTTEAKRVTDSASHAGGSPGGNGDGQTVDMQQFGSPVKTLFASPTTSPRGSSDGEAVDGQWSIAGQLPGFLLCGEGASEETGQSSKKSRTDSQV